MNSGKTELQVKRENFKITWSQFSDYIAELMNQEAVNDYRQKFFFNPHLHINCVALALHRIKLLPIEIIDNAGRKTKQSFCL